MNLNISSSVDEVINSIAEYVIDSASKSIAEDGRFTIALSGGSSPKKLYEALASSSFRDRIEWKKVYFFFGDERYVPATHPDSNFRMADKALFEPLKIDRSQVFPVNTTLPPPQAAKDYMEQITGFFGDKEPRFHLILLGLGDNSHTASLFPETPVLHETEASVKEVFLNDQKVFRITLTAPLINLAERIAFLVYGDSKSAAVHSILEGKRDIDNFPAQLINPESGEVQWFLDKPAASRMDTYLKK
jgi:6-phosphogluconolactonase